MYVNKSPPKIRGRAQTKRPNSPEPVAPIKLGQQTGATKSSSQYPKRVRKQKTSHLAMRNWLVFKDLCWVFYHDVLFAARGTVRMVITQHVKIIDIVLLLVQIALSVKLISLEHQIYALSLLHR